MNDRPVTLAAITGAHGVTGEVRLKLFGDGLDSLRRHKSFNDGSLSLSKLKDDGKGGAIARFAGVDDRNAAEALRGTSLTVARDALPPLEEGEYYHTDLIGLAAVDESGATIGSVADVLNYGAGDLVEIEKADGKRYLVPLTERAVPRWDRTTLTVAADFVD